VTTPSYHDILEQAPSLGPTEELAANVTVPGADRPWVFVGCGASYHAGTAAAGLLSALGGQAQGLPASEVWMNPDLWLRPDSVVVGLSRTGTTTETVAALRTAHERGAHTIGASLAPGTPVVEQVDTGLVLDHVGESGRVMTRSFANLLVAAQSFAVSASVSSASAPDVLVDDYRTGLRRLGGVVEASVPVFDELARVMAEAPRRHVVFLGSGPDLGICRQGALQMQETARAAVEAHAVLDYRHGPLAALDPDSLVVLLTSDRSLPADLLLAEDVGVLGGTLVAIGPTHVVEQLPAHVQRIATSDGLPRWLGGNVALPFLQLLAYHLTVARDADPESVRNLDRTKQPHVNPHVLPADLLDHPPA
jgi:glucosamine--fructose-6-phosphate aminotransferase (isomerizing)